jgi:hypothetical protein
MPCIHHYSIIQNSCTSLKFLCALLVPPPPPFTGNHRSFYCFHRFAFSRILLSWNHIICKPFQTDFIHLVICIASVCFHSSFFLCPLWMWFTLVRSTSFFTLSYAFTSRPHFSTAFSTHPYILYLQSLCYTILLMLYHSPFSSLFPRVP